MQQRNDRPVNVNINMQQRNDRPVNVNINNHLTNIIAVDINNPFADNVGVDLNDPSADVDNILDVDINDHLADIISDIKSYIDSRNTPERTKSIFNTLSEKIINITKFKITEKNASEFKKDQKPREIVCLLLIIINLPQQLPVPFYNKSIILCDFWKSNQDWLTPLLSNNETIPVSMFTKFLKHAISSCKIYPTEQALNTLIDKLLDEPTLKAKIFTSIDDLNKKNPDEAADLLSDIMFMLPTTVDIFLNEIVNIELLNKSKSLIRSKIVKKNVKIIVQENIKINEMDLKFSDLIKDSQDKIINDLEKKVNDRINILNGNNEFGGEIVVETASNDIIANNPLRTTTSSTYIAFQEVDNFQTQSQNITPEEVDKTIKEIEQQICIWNTHLSTTETSKDSQHVTEQVEPPAKRRKLNDRPLRPLPVPIAAAPAISSPITFENENQLIKSLFNYLRENKNAEIIDLISNNPIDYQFTIKKDNSITAKEACDLLLIFIKHDVKLAIKFWEENIRVFTELLANSIDDFETKLPANTLFDYCRNLNQEFLDKILKEPKIRNKILYAMPNKEITTNPPISMDFERTHDSSDILDGKTIFQTLLVILKINANEAISDWKNNKEIYKVALINLSDEDFLKNFTDIIRKDLVSQLSCEILQEDAIKNKLKNAILNLKVENEIFFNTLLQYSTFGFFKTYISLIDDSKILYGYAIQMNTIKRESQKFSYIQFASKRDEFNKKVVQIIKAKMQPSIATFGVFSDRRSTPASGNVKEGESRDNAIHIIDSPTLS